MALQHIVTQIDGDSPGQRFELVRYKCGPDSAPTKIFLQAGLHADEQPGMMVLHHFLDLLESADAAGQLAAQFVVMPMVNPIGMGQIQFHTHRGRYNPVNGINYNRRWPNVMALLGDAEIAGLAVRLSPDDGAANRQLVRRVVAACLARQTPVTAVDKLRLEVMRETYDSDMVFDLHCDDEALNHIFIVPQLMPAFQDLADWMGAAAVLTAEDSGGGSFDEVWPGFWLQLVRRYPDKAIADVPFAATLEYRGLADVNDSVNRQDAHNLVGFFRARGFITGDKNAPPPQPKTTAPAAKPLAATEILRVTSSGVLAYQVRLGDMVQSGDVIAYLVALDGPQAYRARTPITAGTSGQVISLRSIKYVWPGCSIAKIAGDHLLPNRQGYLLED